MGFDEFITSDHENLNEEDKRLIRKIKLQDPTPTKRGGVYVIYHRETGEPLYVGRTEKLIRRISDHFRRTDGKQLLGLIDRDDNINIERGTSRGQDGNIWEKTSIKFVEIESAKRRRRIENAFEKELDVRYPSG